MSTKIINSFFSEFTPIISSFDKTKSDVIIADDFNISLLKINENEVFGEVIFFYMLISYSFYPHFTLATRVSNNNGTLIDKLFCKLTDSGIKPK